MHTTQAVGDFHATVAHPIVVVGYGAATGGYRTALAVEVPLMALALGTVVLRVFSRLTIKRRLAADDILILLGTVCCASSIESLLMLSLNQKLKERLTGCCVGTNSHLVHECRRQLGV
jgi:hypothetical protein